MLQLVQKSGLMTAGIQEHLSKFLVAEQDSQILATAGLEMGDECSLLRSVAVEEESRGTGLGTEIVRQALRLALVSGAATVYLMTSTAAGFFPKFGFKPALRAEIDGAFPDSAETASGGCGEGSEAMVLRDLSRVLDPHLRG
jgi:amino-acid N-acetyltransferase